MNLSPARPGGGAGGVVRNAPESVPESGAAETGERR